MGDKISILIPVYNRERYIKDTVTSALHQTYEDIEIVIVDNHSTDNTWEIVKNLATQDPRIRIFQNQTNIGPVKNWSRCIEMATGKYGKILWSDDLISPDFLEKTIHFLSDDDVGFVFTGTEIFYDEISKKCNAYFIGKTGVYTSEKYISGILFGENFPSSPGCALFRLKDLNQNLLIDIPNKINSDFSMHGIGNDLLILLLTAHQYPMFAFVNEKLSFFRAHKDSISVRTSEGLLTFNYDMVKSFFVENFRPDLILRLNAVIWEDVHEYSCAENKRSLTDFYLKNDNFTIPWGWLLLNIIQNKMALIRLKLREICVHC